MPKVTRPAPLQPEAPSEEAVRREHEAMEIILLAKDLLDSTKLLTFFETIVTVEADPIKAFQVSVATSSLPSSPEWMDDTSISCISFFKFSGQLLRYNVFG